MRLLKPISAGVVCLLLTIPLTASARDSGRGSVVTGRLHRTKSGALHRLVGISRIQSGTRGRSAVSYPSYTQTFGWPYAYNGYWGNPYYSGLDSAYFPYLYFYEQYAREAEESRRAADEFEASLAREGKLTGPLPVGAFATDFRPGSPLRLPVTLDGQSVEPSPSGAALVIESGKHDLRIGSAGTHCAN